MFRQRWCGTGQLNTPSSVAVDNEGNIIVVEYNNHRVQVFRPDGSVARSFGSHGAGPGQLTNPFGVAVDGEGKILVADYSNSRVQIF